MSGQGQGWLFAEAEQKPDLSQWYTPPKLAERVVAWTLGHHPEARRIIEPAAGRGALAARLAARISPQLAITAYDIDPENVAYMRERLPEATQVVLGDFLAAEKPPVDLVLMNPPFEHDNDCRFVLEALHAAPVCVSILRGVVEHGVGRWELLWRWVDIVRKVVLIERPQFGGQHSPKQDFVVMELRARAHARERGEAMVVETEWW